MFTGWEKQPAVRGKLESGERGDKLQSESPEEMRNGIRSSYGRASFGRKHLFFLLKFWEKEKRERESKEIVTIWDCEGNVCKPFLRIRVLEFALEKQSGEGLSAILVGMRQEMALMNGRMLSRSEEGKLPSVNLSRSQLAQLPQYSFLWTSQIWSRGKEQPRGASHKKQCRS